MHAIDVAVDIKYTCDAFHFSSRRDGTLIPLKQMPKIIQQIAGKVPNTDRDILIDVDGKNLIIVGGNGSGKTSLLRKIYQKLDYNIVKESVIRIGSNIDALAHTKKILDRPRLSESERISALNSLESFESFLDNALGTLPIKFAHIGHILEAKRKNTATIRLFEADRKSNIATVKSITGVAPDNSSIDPNLNLGQNLEQHLVNLKVRAALAARKESNAWKVQAVDAWFDEFEKNLRYLFENDSTELHFLEEKLKFEITQDSRSPFNFQTLSSGYSSIFDIYADLLMRTEYFEVTPANLEGVVLIDELDAHLHVSLQRKVLPFLTRSFPKLQFIITTHSPFVLTSVENALIYDISTNKTSTDLSMYSFEAVVEGLLGVPPISEELEKYIKELATLTEEGAMDLAGAESVIKRIEPYLDSLDSESRMFFEIARNKIIKYKTDTK